MCGVCCRDWAAALPVLRVIPDLRSQVFSASVRVSIDFLNLQSVTNNMSLQVTDAERLSVLVSIAHSIPCKYLISLLPIGSNCRVQLLHKSHAHATTQPRYICRNRPEIRPSCIQACTELHDQSPCAALTAAEPGPGTCSAGRPAARHARRGTATGPHPLGTSEAPPHPGDPAHCESTCTCWRA